MLRLKEWLKTPLGIAITTAFIGPAITIVYDIVKNKPVFSTIVFAMKWLYTFILSILNFNLKVWWVILGILGCIFILYIIYKFQEFNENNQPEFLRYTKDTIQGWKWEWHWEKDYTGKYAVENLHPICINCDSPLVNKNDYQGNLYCVRCGRQRSPHNMPDFKHIEAYIYDNVRKDLFPKEQVNCK